MDWTGIAARTLAPIAFILVVLGIGWLIQGWLLVKPEAKEEIGKALNKGGKWLIGIGLFLLCLAVVLTVLTLLPE